MTTPETGEEGREQEMATDNPAHEARIRLGERLSQARQAKEMNIVEASDRLRIRSAYLEALECGDWSPLPEEVYVMGFLRQYAALLVVDLSKEIESLKTGEYHLTKPFTMPDPPIAMNRTWALVAGACFLLLLILFNVVDEGEKDQSPPAPASKLPLAAMTTSPEATVPAEKAKIVQPEAQPPAAAPVEASGQTVPTKPEAVEPAANAKVSPASKPNLPDTEPAASVAGVGHDFQLTAVAEDVWLQLHAPDGSLLKEVLLRSGQSLRLKTDADYLMLTAGNPLALSVSIDGRTIAEAGTLGEKGKVLHDYRLPPNKTDNSR